MDLIAKYSLELNEGVNLKKFLGLGFCSIEVLPHYSRYLSRFNKFEEKAKLYEIENNCEVIRINDGQVVIVDFGKHSII